MKEYKIYKIKWIDSQSDDGWQFDKDKGNILPFIANTVGFKVYENKKIIRMALSYGANTDNNNQQFNGTITIPKCCILKIQKIKV
jgi:hypothetical protein